MAAHTQVSDLREPVETRAGFPLPQLETEDDDEISILDLLIVLLERKRLIAWVTLGFAVTAAAVSLILPKEYTAGVTLLPPQQNSSISSQLAAQLGGLGGIIQMAGSGGLLKNPNDMYVAMLKSRTVEDAMIQRFNLMQEYHKEYLSDTRKKFERHATVDGSGKDGLIHIEVKDHDPVRAAAMANAYVDQFRALSQSLAITEAQQRRKFFEDQLNQANQNLANAEEALTEMQQKTGLIQLDSQARALIESAAMLRAQVAAKEVQIQAMQTFATGENAQLIQAQQELAGLRAQLTKLSGGGESPDAIIVPKGQMTSAGMEYVRRLRDVKYYETIFEIPEFEPLPDIASLRQPQDNQVNTLPSAHSATDSLSQVEAEQDPYSEERNQGAQNTKQTAQNSSLAGTQNLLPSRSQGSSEPVVVRVPAPEIDWDYAVIERINQSTLKTDLVPFDLGKLVLQHDQTQDLVLEPNDVVTIFSEADIPMPVAEQTKLVLLQGEFVHAGFYSVLPGETLRQLVERAGGLTANAYLYGSEFTRQSTRVIQQARIDEYVRNLEMNMQRSTVQLASSAGAASQGSASLSAAQASEQNVLAGLRQVRATGRIVLSFQPDSRGAESIPDIALEDSDRFIVPHAPTAVNVVGAVYNQNSFLYKPGARTGTYMRLAGGPNRDASNKRAFVIRADGEVVSRDMTKGPWGNGFNDLRIYPGDTIVVPEKALKPSALYGAMYWSQMFSQFALGAASLSIVAP